MYVRQKFTIASEGTANCVSNKLKTYTGASAAANIDSHQPDAGAACGSGSGSGSGPTKGELLPVPPYRGVQK